MIYTPSGLQHSPYWLKQTLKQKTTCALHCRLQCSPLPSRADLFSTTTPSDPQTSLLLLLWPCFFLIHHFQCYKAALLNFPRTFELHIRGCHSTETEMEQKPVETWAGMVRQKLMHSTGARSSQISFLCFAISQVSIHILHQIPSLYHKFQRQMTDICVCSWLTLSDILL